jgi:hypothetical protein
MKKLLLFTALFSSIILFAQNEFRAGYYIDNLGIKTEGFIKASNFRLYNDNSFTAFEFKKELNQTIQTIEKANVSAFGSGGEVKFQKMKAMIDDVSFFADYTTDKNFAVKEKTVFLNVLVEGLATLYSYDSGQGTKYLWQIVGQDDVAKQLLYKKYYRSKSSVAENNAFREQLFNYVKCPNQTFNDFLKVKYKEGELIALFKKYNTCTDSKIVVYDNLNTAAATFNFSVLLGYNIGNFRVDEIQYPTIPENFGMFSVGLEGELILASRKFGIFGSFEFKNGKSASESTGKVSAFSAEGLRKVYRFDSNFLDIALGCRFYKNTSPTSAFFVGAGAGLNIGYGELVFSQALSPDSVLEVIDTTSLQGSGFVTLHIGYRFNKYFAIDINYDSPKNIINRTNEEVAKVHEFGMNLRYTF